MKNMLEVGEHQARAHEALARGLDDCRLGDLEATLRRPGVSMLTLDIFDTLLWRRVAKPTDAFLLLGEELIARGALAGGISPATFAGMRMAAEGIARARKATTGRAPEVHLGEIYAEFNPGITELTIDELRAAEVSLERRITVVDHLLAQTLSTLAAELDLRVVFVSDMYLSGEELKVLLDRPEMGSLAEAEIISSADVGMGKENGLWDVLPDCWGVSPSSIVHVGNNPNADVIKPREAGLLAAYWPELPDRLAAIVAAEGCSTRASAKVRVSSPLDGGLNALRGRAAFSTSRRDHEDQVAWETGASILGPVMAGYADWVHRRAGELGIERALCIMREGRFLKELLESVAPSRRNPSLQPELLWASRAAIARANIAQGTPKELSSMFNRACVPSVAEAARTLGIEQSTVPLGAELDGHAAHRGGNPDMLNKFLNAVLRSPELVEQIRRTSARRRANFVAHLRDALGGVTGDVAYIDVGFSGSNQESLQKLIDAEGIDVRLHGLYLMCDPCPPDRLLRGHRVEGFITSPHDPDVYEVVELDRNRLLIELLMLSEDGSTLEIDDEGRPVFAPHVEPERQRAQRRAVHDGIRAYQRHVNAYLLAADDERDLATVDGAVGRRIIERFVVEPTLEEARTFGSWEAEDDFNSLEMAPLVPGPEDGILRRLTRKQLADQPLNRVFWPAAATTLWEDLVAEKITGPLSQAGALRVQLHRTSGSAAGALVPLRLGRDGVSIATWSGAVEGLCGLTVFPVTIDGLLRLDSLTVAQVSKLAGWRSVLWSWSAGDDPAALSMSNCTWVAQDILNVDSESALIVPLDRTLSNGDIVQIEFHGGFLPGVDTTPRLESAGTGATIGHRRPTDDEN
jgi:hypothetical protein